jgi:hypothetical protein
LFAAGLLPLGVILALQLSKHAKPVRFEIDPERRKLSGPDVEFEFPEQGYLALDSFFVVATNSRRQGSSRRVVRLSWVDGSATDAELRAREEEIAGRPNRYRRKNRPALPGGGRLVASGLPYGLARVMARELGRSLGLRLIDLTSRPARRFEPGEQELDLESLREAQGARIDLAAPPRSIRRSERPGVVSLRFAASSLWARVFILFALLAMGLVLYVCSGLNVYAGALPVLMSLLAFTGIRWQITPEGISSATTWFGLSLGTKFFSYAELSDISAPQNERVMRLVVTDAIHRVVLPSRAMVDYLVAAALNPPEYEGAQPGPYR